MKIRRVRSLPEFQSYQIKTLTEQQSLRDLEESLERAGKQSFKLQGYCYPAGREVSFGVDRQYSADGKINWRERVVCPITNLNNRLRASVHLMDIELAPFVDDHIYISEQVTPLYHFLRARYPNLIGSEFLGFDIASGSVNAHGVRHEDMTALSFADESLDCILSFDCFEHFPTFEKAFAECSRVLKPGGKIMWSVPFVASNSENTIRAKIIDGEIVHILPPEYHGDPVNTAGCLCFTHFGWEMLEQMRRSGFKDAYAVPYGSTEFGYLGSGQLVFFAVK
jgi:SAM-dependent methyltransferase